MSLVIAREISLRYGGKVLLDRASFVLGARDRAGLIGPNGSGKSSLLKLLAGSLTPDAGQVQLVRRSRAGYNRSFVNGLATHVWEVKDLGLDARPGNLDDWQRRRAESAEPAAQATRPERSSGQGKDARRERAIQRERRLRALKPLLEEIGRIEARIARLEQEKKEAEARLADPGVFADPARSTSAFSAYRDAQRELDELHRVWEERQEELERTEARLDQG